MNVKGSPFVYLPKANQKPSAEKKVMARTSKGFCADSRASSGHNEENTRTFQGQKRLKGHVETNLGQAKYKKRLRKGSH